MANSTPSLHSRKATSKSAKPAKPRKDWPLFPHATGRWAKKVRGRLHYFGPWSDPNGALNRWLDQKDDLLAGRKPRAKATSRSVSVSDGCNLYLDHIEAQVSKGRRTHHWYQDAKRTCALICETVGRNWAIESIGPDDFKELQERFDHKEKRTAKGKVVLVEASPVTSRGHNHRTRGLFNWLVKAGHIKSLPQFGIGFDPPGQVEIDNHRNEQDAKHFTRAEVRGLLKASHGDGVADLRMHAAILLAINTGCQNEDVQTLRFRHIDWRGGWYNQPRKKTGKQRRAKLWARTLKALRRMVANREHDDDDLVFVSGSGNSWHGRNCLAKEFPKYRTAAGITRERAGFQWLRHTFITAANETGDRLAVQISVGHADRSITANYIHSIFDPRQVAIAKHVENWLN